MADDRNPFEKIVSDNIIMQMTVNTVLFIAFAQLFSQVPFLEQYRLTLAILASICIVALCLTMVQLIEVTKAYLIDLNNQTPTIQTFYPRNTKKVERIVLFVSLSLGMILIWSMSFLLTMVEVYTLTTVTDKVITTDIPFININSILPRDFTKGSKRASLDVIDINGIDNLI
jgi:hypothetical protein